MKSYIFAVFTVVLITLSSIPVTVYSDNIADEIDIGYKIIYAIAYYTGKWPGHVDQFEINVIDKYVSFNMFFDFRIKYINASPSIPGTITTEIVRGTRTSTTLLKIPPPPRIIENTYKGIVRTNLSGFIPMCEERDVVEVLDRGESSISIPIPVEGWNPRIGKLQPLGYKSIFLKVVDFANYTLEIGGVNITIDTILLENSDNRYRYVAMVDRYTGMLVYLEIRDHATNTLLYKIYLKYYTGYLQENMGKTTETNHQSRSIDIKKYILYVFIGLAVAIAAVVYIIFSRISRSIRY